MPYKKFPLERLSKCRTTIVSKAYLYVTDSITGTAFLVLVDFSIVQWGHRLFCLLDFWQEIVRKRRNFPRNLFCYKEIQTHERPRETRNRNFGRKNSSESRHGMKSVSRYTWVPARCDSTVICVVLQTCNIVHMLSWAEDLQETHYDK